jgi:hypothetical protein
MNFLIGDIKNAADISYKWKKLKGPGMLRRFESGKDKLKWQLI